MSVQSPGSGRPNWDTGPKPKPQGEIRGLSLKIPHPEETSPGKLSPRTITNMATKNATDKRIEHAAQIVMPKLSERDTFISDFMYRLSQKILPKAGISIPPIGTYPDDTTIKRLGLDKSDPYLEDKVPLLLQLEADTSLSPSRKQLLTQMLRKPEALLNGLPSFSEVTVGTVRIKPKEHAPIKAINSVGEALKGYVTSQNPDLAEQVEMHLDELLYATCQTFFNSLMERQASDVRFKDSSGKHVWAPDAKRLVSKDSFQMEKARFFKPDTVVIKRTKEVTYMSTGRAQGEKHLTMQVECRYNLKNNKVSFTYMYDLDGDKKTWSE